MRERNESLATQGYQGGKGPTASQSIGSCVILEASATRRQVGALLKGEESRSIVTKQYCTTSEPRLCAERIAHGTDAFSRMSREKLARSIQSTNPGIEEMLKMQ